jgi:hypothetical protein
MTFSLYDAPSGGSALWSEAKTEVSDSAGIFATALGSDSPIDIPFSDPCWLEIAVDGETLMPRRGITSIAFAFRALRADSLGGFGPDGFVQQGQSNSVTTLMIVDGTLTDADVSGSAAIDPAKIAGGAWTHGNDGAGSGLDADMVDGLHESAFADSNHNHDSRYYTETELNTTGSLNNASNPVDWTRLKSVPAGLADGTDDVGGTGDGYSLDAADGSPTDVVYVDNAGNVGVGTTTPKCLLDVHKGSSGSAASLSSTSLLVESNSQANIKLLSPNGSFQSITFGAPTNPTAGWIAYDHDEQRLRLGADDGDRLTITRGGYVGIGTNEPASELHLAKNVNAPLEITLTNESTGPLSAMGLLFSDEETDAGLRVYDNDAASYPSDLLIFNGHDRGHIVFETMTQNAVTIDSAGKVGIGTYLPEQQLHVQSYDDTYARIETRRTSGTAGLVLANDGPGWEIDLRGDMSDAFLIYGGTGGWPRFLIDTNGKVGIGTTSPASLLDIAGTAQMTGFKLPTGATAGKFLTCNASGVGTWATVAGAPDADWTISGSDMYSGVAGKVGIGASSPGNKLQVSTTSTGNLAYAIKVENPGLSTNGTATGILFKVDGGENTRGKGALVYEQTDTWNRGDFHFLQGTGTGTSAPVTLAEAVMTIKNNGRVGIGTKSPANQLHVKSANTSCGIEVESNLTDGIAALVLANDARAWTLTTEGPFGDGFMITDPGVGYRALFIDTNHNMGISTTAPTARLDINGATGYDQVRMRTSYTPTSTADAHGNVGDIAWDADYVYVKTAAGWKRAALGAW